MAGARGATDMAGGGVGVGAGASDAADLAGVGGEDDVASLTCSCASPKPYERPSGTQVCMNLACGLPIAATMPPKKEKP